MMDWDKLFQWNRLFAPTGEEAAAGKSIFNMLQSAGYSVEVDNTNTVLAKLGGKGERVLICVPYDQKGMLITGKYQQGGYYLNQIGRWDATDLKDEPGIATGGAAVAIHVHKDAENYKAPYNLELNYTDGRCGTDMIGNKVVVPAPEKEILENGNHLFSVSMLDNRAACFAVDAFLEQVRSDRLNVELYVAFLALDTCCFRGIESLAQRLHPDWAIEISCRDDDAWERGALVVNHIGTKYLSDPLLVRRAIKEAERMEIPLEHRFKRPPAASDALTCADSLIPFGCRTLSLSLPVWQKNWRAGYVNGQSMEKMASLLRKLVMN